VLVHDRQARRARPYQKAVGDIDRFSSHKSRFCAHRRASATHVESDAEGSTALEVVGSPLLSSDRRLNKEGPG
jgi:hypothetical protein